ncbi:flavin reductase family protein [Caldalkalibacillus salinus]|uniref:flavin reductase family protein n=1 Tax=Caldalkalibacillus salinus TaxID=2803787 RepID=UPI00192196BD|nr:flavin reductase family protein [Caldalkalibacillus salinus]
MKIDPSTLSRKEAYKLLIGSVVPRPIAWVSTTNEMGVHNIAPFSFFTVVSTNPAMLAFNIGPNKREDGSEEKDTLANIKETKQFVINLVTMPNANAMHESSLPYSPETNEFEKAGLTAISGERVKAPRVKESPINMECELDQIIELNDDRLVIGKLVYFHVDDEYYMANGRIDIEKLQVVGRLAGNYALIENLFDLPQ